MVHISVRRNKHLFSRAFTLVELLIVIAIIGVIGTVSVVGFTGVQKNARDQARDSQTTIIANALEKYYDDNNEYPSVAMMTSQNVDLIKQKLKITDSTILKFPLATTESSIVASNPSPTLIVYSANTSDSTKNAQCQTDANGYCDGFVLQYKKEFDGSVVVANSLHNTFTPVAGTATCAAGETQSGNTCTKTYAATSQPGAYSCPSGGTLSGSTCSSSYSASYVSNGSYTCPSGGTLSGTTCTQTTPASFTAAYYTCNTGSVSGSSCVTSAMYTEVWGCSHPDFDTYISQSTCRHDRPNYTTQSGCQNAGYTWSGGSCMNYHSTVLKNSSYSCEYGWSLSGSSCSTPASYHPATYSCSTGTLSGTNCVSTYTATYSSGSYYCANGGSLNGSTCTYEATSAFTCMSGSTYYSSSCYTLIFGGGSNAADDTAHCDPYGGSMRSGPSGYGCYTLSPAFPALSCPNGGTLSGTTCSYSASYGSSGYYYCSGGGNLSGSTCYTSYAATQASSYYYCADGGTLSGSTCTYTYTLP